MIRPEAKVEKLLWIEIMSDRLNLETQLKLCRELGNCFEFMPDSDGTHKQSELPSHILKKPILDRVTFFGGSFNPFHPGHRACLDLCPEENILIVPDCNPFKKNNKDQDVYYQFLELSELLRDTKYSLYPGFLGKNQPNPTASWLPKVKIKEKNFLMGDDSYMSLLTWNEPSKIIESLTILYVVPRLHSREEYLIQEKKILKINPALIVHYLDTHPYQNISSTKLRER